jgi:hypothetical protein
MLLDRGTLGPPTVSTLNSKRLSRPSGAMSFQREMSTGFQLLLPGGLGRAFLTRVEFEDDLGLKLRGESPALAFRHGKRLLRRQC